MRVKAQLGYAQKSLKHKLRRVWRNSSRRWKHKDTTELEVAEEKEREIREEEGKLRYEADRLKSEDEKARVIAAVLVGFEELLGAQAAAPGFYDTIMDELWDDGKHIHWVQAALELGGGRIDEFLTTLLAVISYILQVASAFTPQFGGEPATPPGHVHFVFTLLLNMFGRSLESRLTTVHQGSHRRGSFSLIPYTCSRLVKLHRRFHRQKNVSHHRISLSGRNRAKHNPRNTNGSRPEEPMRSR